jgi:hypothetical protein
MKSSIASLLTTSGCLLLLASCGRTSLQIDPEVVSGCLPAKPEAIKVTWDTGREKPKMLAVQIGRPGRQQRRFWFHTDAPRGSRSTGRWGIDGMTFFLVDSHGRELARRTIEARPCADRAARSSQKQLRR